MLLGHASSYGTLELPLDNEYAGHFRGTFIDSHYGIHTDIDFMPTMHPKKSVINL